MRRTWDLMQEQLGFHDVVINTLRHTCASWLVQSGVDIMRVKKKMSGPSKAQRLAKLSSRFDVLVERIEHAKQQLAFKPDIAAEAISLLTTVRKLGLQVPANRWPDKTDEMMTGVLAYLRVVGPLARDGHYKEAAEAARELSILTDKQTAPHDPEACMRERFERQSKG
jgi:hypothetical protein